MMKLQSHRQCCSIKGMQVGCASHKKPGKRAHFMQDPDEEVSDELPPTPHEPHAAHAALEPGRTVTQAPREYNQWADFGAAFPAHLDAPMLGV